MHARGDACTRVLGYVCFNMTTHIYTCARPTCKFWLYSDALERVFLQNPDLWASNRLPPRCSSQRGCSFMLFCICLGHIYDVEPCLSQVVAISYPVSPERGVSPYTSPETPSLRYSACMRGGTLAPGD